MDATTLSSFAGILLSLVFSYVPNLKTWYAALTPQSKSLVMLASLAVVAVGIFGGSCLGWYALVSCDQQGALGLGKIFVAALIANQGTYLLTTNVAPAQPPAVG